MAILYSASAPSGWGVDETGHFVKVPTGYVVQGGQYVAPSGSSPSPTTSSTRPPVFSTPAPAPTPAPAAEFDWDAQTKQQKASIPSNYKTVSSSVASQIQNGSSTDYEDIRTVSKKVGNSIDVEYYAYQIPKATLVNAQGQRVVVRTDGKPGSAKLPSSNDMFSQGYRLEKAPGVPVQPFTTTGQQTQQTQTNGAIDQRQNPDILLPDGRHITSSDPQYSQLKDVPGSLQINPQTGAVVPSINGNIQTFADGSQLDLSTGLPIARNTQGAPSSSGTPTVPQGSDIGSTITGVDTNGWTEPMKQAYQAMSDYVTKLTSQGKIVNPNITIDDSTIARFADQAKAELDPYYKQVFDQATQDVQTAISRAKEDYSTKEKGIASNFAQNLEGTQENYARRGLEFSSDRDKAEQQVRTQTQSDLDAAQRATTRSIQDISTQGERKIGSDGLPSLDTSLSFSSVSNQSRPGIYSLNPGTQTTRAFNPLGGVTGDIGRQQLFDTESRKNDLINNERQYRASNYQ